MEEMNHFFSEVVPLAVMVIGAVAIAFIAWNYILQKPIKPVIKGAFLACVVIVMLPHLAKMLIGEGDLLAKILWNILMNLLNFIAEALDLA